MSILPRPTVDSIYALYKNSDERLYLGGSQIGNPCGRALWYQFRNVKKPSYDGLTIRLFETGNIMETRIIYELRQTGVTVLDEDPSTKEQWRFKECMGHFSVGLDGVVLGLKEAPETYHLLEIKTANQKSFDQMEKKGIKDAKPQHYDQCQVGMGMASLDRAVYIVHNKNTDELYVERLKFDSIYYKSLLLKASRIITSKTPLEKISEDQSFYLCKQCQYFDICHTGLASDKNCRTCIYSAPVNDGGWYCEKNGLIFDGKFMCCEEHTFIGDLDTIPF